MRRRALWLICLLALVHAALFIVYQRPAWDSSWTDQRGYKRLGEVLATTGEFTRYPGAAVFVPEVIRTPGYPAFVAAVYLVAGAGNHLAVAIAQALVFSAICVLVFFLARYAAGERAATTAALLTALYSPLPYFGALVLTELWTAFMATAALLVCRRAVLNHNLRTFALAGILFSGTTLARPAFVLLPFFLAIAVPLLVRHQRTPRALKGWAALAIAAALTLTPWFAYNYTYLGAFTLSPAGGVGRGLWEGSWQGRWPGRVQARLTTLAEQAPDRVELDANVGAVAADTGLPVEPMLTYVHEWRDIHDLWDTPQDPVERAKARIAVDQEYLRAASVHMREDPIGHVIRRITTGSFVLWAAETPIRYSDVNTTPTIAIRMIWMVQVVLLALAGWGAISLARRGDWLDAVLLVLPLIYVTGVHLPLLSEARQSLPVKPVILVLAAIAITSRPITSPETADS